MTKHKPRTTERLALNSACEACFYALTELRGTVESILDCDLENHEQPWRVVENTHALAGALANLLHQVYSKRPNVNAPVADIVTETRPTRMDLPDHAPTTQAATAE